MTDVRIVDAEALIVGPDEVLILRFPKEQPPQWFEQVLAALNRVGLKDRTLLIAGDVEFVKVPR